MSAFCVPGRHLAAGRRFLLIALLALATPSAPLAAEGRDPYQHFFASGTDDFRAELADAKRGGKKALFVMFEQDGCPGCLYMKEHVLNRPDVQKFYRDHFINFSINIYGSVPFDDFAGRKVTEKTFAQATNIKGTPTLIFYDLEGQEIVRQLGAIRSAEEFILFGEFVATGAYRSRKFADYIKERKARKGS
ncbi:MAG TPA: thioredoxin family protein [Burkholderiales bacterium]|jgi:thioredoxin-related protein|nr:thioredoxin family protein [Burkholderiales bacterium]